MKRYTILIEGSAGQIRMKRRVTVDAVHEGGALDAVSDRASSMFPGHFRMDVEKVEEAPAGSSPGVVISSSELPVS
jgi:hypothetical protein